MSDRARLLQGAGFNQLAQVAEGYCLYNVNDAYIGASIARYGESAGLETRLLAELCHPGDVVMDIGANIGVHTMAFARRVGPGGAVIAFEAQRLVFQSLCANVAINSLANVECHWAAVGARRGVLTVPELAFDRPNNFGGVSLAGAREGRPVPVVALDDFAAIPRLRLVKVDVEGMEAEVIEGAAKLIARLRPILYVENDRVDSSPRLIRMIAALGYDMYWHVAPLFNPANFYGVAENAFPGLAAFNMLCVHREAHGPVEGLRRVEGPDSHPLARQPE
ncbi:MAG TPA: FkbM family methyltransferase [Usitatibacter sp.]|nr:FkbM family methyltransferase [Usitatibacter sp.]